MGAKHASGSTNTCVCDDGLVDDFNDKYGGDLCKSGKQWVTKFGREESQLRTIVFIHQESLLQYTLKYKKDWTRATACLR